MADHGDCVGVIAFDSHEGDGRYFTLGRNQTIRFTTAAYLVNGAECLRGVDCAVGKKRNLSSLWHVDWQTEHRDVTLLYPWHGPLRNDFAFTTVVPIGDLIIETSHSLGVKAFRRVGWTHERLSGGYGHPYVRVGVEEGPFMAIWNRLNSFLRQEDLSDPEPEDPSTAAQPYWTDAPAVDEASSYFTVPSLRSNCGRYWLLARLGAQFQVIVYDEEGRGREIELFALMKEAERSLKCDVMAKFELVRAIADNGKWELAVTLLSVAVIDTTRESSLPWPEDSDSTEEFIGRVKRSTSDVLKAAKSLRSSQRSS